MNSTMVRYLAEQMRGAGDLGRTAEISDGGSVRYRYFRKRELAGPIADLERAYHDDTEGAR